MINNSSSSRVDDTNLQKDSQVEQSSPTESKGGEEVKSHRVQQALKQGIEEFDNEASESQDCIIHLSKNAHEQLKKVAHALNLNFSIVIDCAINYVYFLNQTQKKSLNEIIPDGPEKNEEGQDLHTQEVTFWDETNRKLEKMGLKDRPSDCAIAGIRLLYENNCLLKPNQQSSTTSSSPSL
ncbi:MAG: hypothetical protein ACRCU2_00240 [Planktothrix sp.]